MSKHNKKFTTQKIFTALSSTSQTGKTTQVAVSLDAEGRKKLKIEAAMDDMTPADKAKQALGFEIQSKKADPKLILRLTDAEFGFLAQKYGIDPSDKLSIRNKVADELANLYNE